MTSETKSLEGKRNTMKFKVKKLCRNCLGILALFVICSFVYHEIAANVQEWFEKGHRYKLKDFNEPPWRDRAPRSVSKDYEINAINDDKQVLNRTGGPSIDIGDFKYYQETSSTKPPIAISLDDFYISVKTTKSFHKTRLDLIIKTWFNLAKKQTWFYTDTDDAEYQQKTDGHLINTNCSSTHNRRDLCCKMAREYDGFLASKKRWWCHFDDDNYVNIPALVKIVQTYNPLSDWYLGKPSIKIPVEILNTDNIAQKIYVFFATGGAGFCISKSLALKMVPIASGGKFIRVGEKIRFPDDVTMGYIIEHLLGKKLTVVEEFHSHLEPMKFLSLETLPDQITFSYSKYDTEMNVLPIPGSPKASDPTRFLALHCLLFPSEKYCKR